MSKFFKHSTALVESQDIGQGTRIWAFVHILEGAVIGKNCNIGDYCFIESGVIIGDNVTIKNHTAIWEGITIEQNAFIGPNVIFTNDLWPRSPRLPIVSDRYKNKKWLRKTLIKEGATIGANAIILCGLEIGEYALIGAGTLVTRSVSAHSLVYGIPGRNKAHVCQCGEKLAFTKNHAVCTRCGSEYVKEGEHIVCSCTSVKV
jgi:acetyltransferase-like isoleucine patch superfamily enzyme